MPFSRPRPRKRQKNRSKRLVRRPSVATIDLQGGGPPGAGPPRLEGDGGRRRARLSKRSATNAASARPRRRPPSFHQPPRSRRFAARRARSGVDTGDARSPSRRRAPDPPDEHPPRPGRRTPLCPARLDRPRLPARLGQVDAGLRLRSTLRTSYAGFFFAVVAKAPWPKNPEILAGTQSRRRAREIG